MAPPFIRVPRKIFTGDFTDILTPVSGDNGKAGIWNHSLQRLEWSAFETSGAVAAHVGLSNPHTQYALSASLGTAAALNTGTAINNVVQYSGTNEITASARVVTPVIRPASDSVASFKIQNSAGTNDIFWIDSTNKTTNVSNSVNMFAAASAGTLITFSSNSGSSTGRFELDLAGNMVFRQNQSSMYFDYYDSIVWRRVGSGYATKMTLGSTSLDVAGTVQMDGLRIDVTPTTETVTCTHAITFSANGANYKIPCVPA